MLERYCEKLAKDWEIERGFRTNISGMFAIPIGENQEIVLTSISDGFTMATTIAPSPLQNRGDFFAKLLAGSMMGQFTKGAVLGLDEKDNVVLSLTVTQYPQYRDFYESLEDFMDTIETWQEVAKAENS